MGTAFAPYCEPLLPIITQHMTYQHSKAIRKAALKTFRHMLVALGESQNISLLQMAFKTYTDQISEALDKMDQKNCKLYVT